jgi:hypothetical protein
LPKHKPTHVGTRHFDQPKIWHNVLTTLNLYLHHCFSHGTPSPFPSIFVPGQFFKKYVASAQDVICEQYVLPSHLNSLLAAVLIATGKDVLDIG